MEAARACLDHSRAGKNGPLIPPASLVATQPLDRRHVAPTASATSEEEEDEVDGTRIVGGLITTLMGDGDLSDFDGLRWNDLPPDALARGLGRPHLTWIFVGPWHARHGVGTRLLATAGTELRRLGYAQLASTFLLGNDSSTLWHWRLGFQLAPLARFDPESPHRSPNPPPTPNEPADNP